MKWIFSLALCGIVFACSNNRHEGSTEHKGGTGEGGGADMNSSVHQGAENTGTTSTPANNYMQQMHTSMNNMMQQMNGMRATGDVDHDFATLMRHHHVSAVEMAQAQVAGGTDPALKAMAQKMVNDQQQEINVFDQYLQAHQQASGKSTYGQRAMKMMTPMDSMHMQGGSLDVMFVSMMITHHEDGVKMAREYLKEGKDAGLKKIAQNIVTTQPREVSQMREWLQKNGGNDAQKGSTPHTGTAASH